MFDYAKKMFSDDKGNPSNARLICTIGSVSIMANWICQCWRLGQFLPFDWSQLSALGMFLGVKVFQKEIELKGSRLE